MTGEQRAAIRMIAVEGERGPAERARRLLAIPDPSTSDLVMLSAMLRNAIRPSRNWEYVSLQDRQTLAIAAIQSLADAGDRDMLTPTLLAGLEVGLSARQMAAAAGISHTAVNKRISS